MYMAQNSDIDLQTLLHEMVDLIHGPQSSNSKTAPPNISPTGFQAPIKGTYYNSGDFSPNTRTDWRHANHQGVDLRASGGTSVYPISSGIVSNVGLDPKGGNVINITHPQGVRAYYAHLGTVKINKGDKVGLDTVIGTVGNSATGGAFPHLHIQTWKNGQLVNPGQFFAVPPYSKVDSSKEKVWLSEQAKNEAKNFDMNAHNGQKFAYNRFDKLLNMIEKFSKLTKC